MALEIVLLTIAFLGIAVFGLYRRGHRVFPEYSHQENLMCVVTFYDRAETLPLIEAYFEQEYIEVRHLKREMKRVGDQDLFTNTYMLRMPQRAEQGELAGYLSTIRTVQSVKITPMSSVDVRWNDRKKGL